MHILVIGGAGMIGRKLAERLLREKKLGGKTIAKLTLQDVVPPHEPRFQIQPLLPPRIN